MSKIKIVKTIKSQKTAANLKLSMDDLLRESMIVLEEEYKANKTKLKTDPDNSSLPDDSVIKAQKFLKNKYVDLINKHMPFEEMNFKLKFDELNNKLIFEATGINKEKTQELIDKISKDNGFDLNKLQGEELKVFN